MSSCYRFNPYDGVEIKEYLVRFVSYPVVPQQQHKQYAPPKEALQRLFIGQLPHGTSQEQLSEMLADSGITDSLRGGLMYLEPIIKWTNNRSPCGCAHVWVFPEDAAAICGALNKRYLLRTTGFFVAPKEGTVVGTGPQNCIVVELARSQYHSTVEGRRIVRSDILSRQQRQQRQQHQQWANTMPEEIWQSY